MKLEIKPVGYGPLAGVLSFHLDLTGDHDLQDQNGLLEVSKKFKDVRKACPYINLAWIECFDLLKDYQHTTVQQLIAMFRANKIRVMGVTSPAYAQNWFTSCDLQVYFGVAED